ncbi:Ankyrin repeat-containing domain [Ilyonectria robusta]
MDEVALQEVCPGFTELQSIPGPVTIRIAHFSLQEYLESDRIKQHKDVEFFGIVKEDAHNQIASICLTICLQPKLKWVKGQSDLLRYSSTHWPDHFKDGGNKQSIEIQALKLFQDLEPPSRAHLGHPPSEYLKAPLHYLAFHNLHSILSKILSETSQSCTSTTDEKTIATSLNEFSAWKQTPLATASKQDHMEVVQLLIEKGANINARHRRTDIYCLPFTIFRARNRKMLRPCLSALEGASQNGHIGIVQFLLERGADTSPHHSRVDSVIQYASAKGHEEIIRLLVEHGADVNCRSGARGSAIQQASCGGHLSIVKFLLEHGADVNCRAGAGGSAIQQASLEGHVSVVKFLLEHGADINCQAGVGRSAIHQASFRGHRSVVKFLLEHGAAFNEPGEQGTALQAAASQGRTGVVKLLLKKGADINLQALSTRVPKTALIAATVSMCAKTVKFLLDNGADMEIQDEIHGTALQVILRAWQRWINNWQGLLPQSIEIFKQLVEKGANTQAALQSASPEVRDLMLRFSGAKVSHGGAE